MKRDRWQDSSDEEEGVSNRKKVVSQRKNLENISIESSLKKSSQNQPVNEQTLCSNRTTAAHEPIEHQNNNHTKMTGTSFEPVHTMSDINTIEKKSSEAKKDQPKEEEYNPAIYGCRSVEEYEKVSYISQGTYGLVFKARCVRSNEIVALKEIKMTPDARKVGFPITALREINILLALRHPNIIRVREMVIGSSLDRVFMVMDYYDFDLKTCMDMSSQTFSTAEVKQLMLQLLAGIHHMHSNWFLHRDLKTSNILYANIGTLCICDFGMARKFGSPVAPYTHEVCTLWYRAPEILLGSPTYGASADMWGIGCIFAEMLSGKPIFPGQGEPDQINRIFRTLGSPNEVNWPGVSTLPNASKVSYKVGSRSKLRELFPLASFSGGMSLSESGFDLLSRLLCMDPARRMTAAEALTHPWLLQEAPRPCPHDCMPQFAKKEK